MPLALFLEIRALEILLRLRLRFGQLLHNTGSIRLELSFLQPFCLLCRVFSDDSKQNVTLASGLKP